MFFLYSSSVSLTPHINAHTHTHTHTHTRRNYSDLEAEFRAALQVDANRLRDGKQALDRATNEVAQLKEVLKLADHRVRSIFGFKCGM